MNITQYTAQKVTKEMYLVHGIGKLGVWPGTAGQQGMVTRGARRLCRARIAQGMAPRQAWRVAYRLARCAFNHWWVGSYTADPTYRSGEL